MLFDFNDLADDSKVWVYQSNREFNDKEVVEINEEIYDAMSEIGYINKGQEVKVIDYRSGQIYVMKKD